MSLGYAKQGLVMDKSQKTEIIKKYARSPKDVGSAEVQIALLTHRVNSLTEHLKPRPHDHSSRRGLIAMVNRRRRLLAYLKTHAGDRYAEIIRRLDLRH